MFSGVDFGSRRFVLGEIMKRVAIVGMATTTRHLAPFDDDEWEIWTLNESPSKRFGYIPRVTRHFQLHPLWNCLREGNQNDPEHGQWLKVQEFPIYMQDKYEEIPASVKYPLEEIFNKYKISMDGPDHWREMDSTFPYMLALALYEEFDVIGIYGFEMGSETEYSYQRPNVHYWLGMARMQYLLTGKPEIIIPDECRLMGWGTKLYGYEMVKGINPMEIEIDRNKFGNQAAMLSGKIAEVRGRRQEVVETIMAIKAQFDQRAKEIQNKKQDPKLGQRRLNELSEELNKVVSPLQKRVGDLDKEIIELTRQLHIQEGAHLASLNWLNRYNSQGLPDTRLDVNV